MGELDLKWLKEPNSIPNQALPTKKLGIKENDMYRFCDQEKETPIHLPNQLWSYVSQKEIMFQQLLDVILYDHSVPMLRTSRCATKPASNKLILSNLLKFKMQLKQKATLYKIIEHLHFNKQNCTEKKPVLLFQDFLKTLHIMFAFAIELVHIYIEQKSSILKLAIFYI